MGVLRRPTMLTFAESFLPQVKAVLGDWNLEVNESKTEFHSVYRAEPTAKDDSRQKLAGNDPWRSNKRLGSLLCTEKTSPGEGHSHMLPSVNLRRYG